jgi:hypothetical protein
VGDSYLENVGRSWNSLPGASCRASFYPLPEHFQESGKINKVLTLAYAARINPGIQG